MIAWTDEAIEAAWNELFQEPYDGTGAPMINAALDAAVKAQKQSGIHDVTDYMNGMADGYEKGRAEALEEAAALAEEQQEPNPQIHTDNFYNAGCRVAAKAIRALKETRG